MRRTLIGGLVAVLALAVAAIAIGAAGTSGGIKFDQTYSAKSVGKSTGVKSRIDSQGTKDATGKPRATRQVRLKFPAGFKFNTDVKAKCTAAKLQNVQSIADARKACPAKSVIGRKLGFASAVTGLAAVDPVDNDVLAFNANKGIIFFVKTRPGEPDNTLIITGKLSGRNLNVTVPPLKNAALPFGEAILTIFNVDIDAAKKGDDFFITTGKCPKSGKWVTTYTAVYDDGKGNVTVKSESPCRA